MYKLEFTLSVKLIKNGPLTGFYWSVILLNYTPVKLILLVYIGNSTNIMLQQTWVHSPTLLLWKLNKHLYIIYLWIYFIKLDKWLYVVVIYNWKFAKDAGLLWRGISKSPQIPESRTLLFVFYSRLRRVKIPVMLLFTLK